LIAERHDEARTDYHKICGRYRVSHLSLLVLFGCTLSWRKHLGSVKRRESSRLQELSANLTVAGDQPVLRVSSFMLRRRNRP
jgi:hypothetical protein